MNKICKRNPTITYFPLISPSAKQNRTSHKKPLLFPYFFLHHSQDTQLTFIACLTKSRGLEPFGCRPQNQDKAWATCHHQV